MNAFDVVTSFKRRVQIAVGKKLAAVYWFGSTVHNEAQAGSDIDLLVETTKPLTASERDQVADIAIDLCAESGKLLDIHYYTTDEITHSPYAHSPFLESVRAEGVLA